MVRIDAHTHLFPPAQVAARAAIVDRDFGFAEIYADAGAELAEADALRAALREGEFDTAVALGFAFAEEREISEQNEYLLAEAAASPDEIVPFATLNLALPSWEAEASRAISAGARGFGELRPRTQGWDPLSGAALRLAAIAKDAGLPLLWHASEPVGHEYPGKWGGASPRELIDVATESPEVTMIGAHLGAGASFYLGMPEVRAATPNLVFDTAAAGLLYDSESIARLVEAAGAERVIFGSDFPLRSPATELKRALAGLPAEAAEAVAGENAERVLSLL